MTGVALWAALVLDAIVAAAVGAWFGLRAHREQTRMRGEAVIRVLDTIASNSPSGRLPRVATLRAVAKSHGLPDPYPPNHPTTERPLT